MIGIGTAGGRFPDRLLQALVEAEWSSALALYGNHVEIMTVEEAKLPQPEHQQLLKKKPTHCR
jgi:hypothetical protein